MVSDSLRAVLSMPLSAWRDTLIELKNDLRDDNVLVVSAGLAFYGILASFPALIALVTLYALFLDPVAVERELVPITRVLPPTAGRLVQDQLHDLVVARAEATLELGLALSLLAVLWTVSSGVLALFRSINLAYFERETRGLLRLRGLALVTTLGFMVFGVVAIASLAVIPPVLEWLRAPAFVLTLVVHLRWPVLVVLVAVGLALLYRIAPDRKRPAAFKWISPGSIVATLCWLAGSAGLSAYVERFGRYNETYGALGAAIVLLSWLWLSGYSVLLGAELNAILERRTCRPPAERDRDAPVPHPPGRWYALPRRDG